MSENPSDQQQTQKQCTISINYQSNSTRHQTVDLCPKPKQLKSTKLKTSTFERQTVSTLSSDPLFKDIDLIPRHVKSDSQVSLNSIYPDANPATMFPVSTLIVPLTFQTSTHYLLEQQQHTYGGFALNKPHTFLTNFKIDHSHNKLSEKSIMPRTVKSIIKYLNSLPQLTTLILSLKQSIDTPYNPNVIHRLSTAISKCFHHQHRNINHANSLRVFKLDLSRFIVTRESFRLLFSLPKPHSLILLSLIFIGTQLDCKSMPYIAKFIANCHLLTSIQLDFTLNKIEEIGAFHLAESLTNLIHLESISLDISGNSLFDIGINPISSALSKLTATQTTLNNNYRRIFSSESTARQSTRLTSLTFGIANTKLSLAGVKNLFSNIQTCKYITNLQLNLSYNDLENDVSPITEYLKSKSGGQLISLELLFGENNITFDSFRSLLNLIASNEQRLLICAIGIIWQNPLRKQQITLARILQKSKYLIQINMTFATILNA